MGSNSAATTMAGTLQPLPSPGVAIFPDLIARQPITLLMKREPLSLSYEITNMDGQPVFRIESERMSREHRKFVIDARSGQTFCTIRKARRTIPFKYYAEVEEDGPHLFDLEDHSGLLMGPRHQMVFANAAEQGKPVQIDFKKKAFENERTVIISGVSVAVVEKKFFRVRTEYYLHVTAGLDMFLIVALAVALDDKDRTEKALKFGAGA